MCYLLSLSKHNVRVNTACAVEDVSIIYPKKMPYSNLTKKLNQYTKLARRLDYFSSPCKFKWMEGMLLNSMFSPTVIVARLEFYQS
jgi:hypothetical protein